jgi:hypothetical protein
MLSVWESGTVPEERWRFVTSIVFLPVLISRTCQKMEVWGMEINVFFLIFSLSTTQNFYATSFCAFWSPKSRDFSPPIINHFSGIKILW